MARALSRRSTQPPRHHVRYAGAGAMRRGVISVLAASVCVVAVGSLPAVGAPQDGCGTRTSSTGNRISGCSANSDPYRPDVEAASPEDRELATALYDRAIAFCEAATISGNRLTSGSNAYTPTEFNRHWGHRPSLGHVPFDADLEWVSKPKMVVIEKGQLMGVMYVAGKRQTFPSLGSIPRPHIHHGQQNEMLHIWTGPDCSSSMEEAFAAAGPWARPSGAGHH